MAGEAVYSHKVECSCAVCGATVERLLTKEELEDELLPEGFVRFFGHIVCSTHDVEIRIRRQEGGDVGYVRRLWADGELTDVADCR